MQVRNRMRFLRRTLIVVLHIAFLFTATRFFAQEPALHDGKPALMFPSAEQLTASLSQQPQASQPELASRAGLAEVPANAAPAELAEGQTPEEVEKALGKPEDVTKLKEHLIYTYPTVKVYFENGRLVNVEERKK